MVENNPQQEKPNPGGNVPPVEPNKEPSLNFNVFIKGLIQFLCSPSGASLIEKIFENKGNAIDKEYEYSFKKYWQDIIMVSVILVSILLIIIISALICPEKPFISETTIGTLLGGVIGYALSRFKSRQED